MHCILADPDSHQLKSSYFLLITDILKQRTTEFEVKKFAVQIMEKSGSFEYTRDYLRTTEQQVRSEIAKLGGNKLLGEIIDGLAVVYSK